MHLTVLVAGITLVFFSTGDRHLAFAQQKARPSPPQVTRVWTPITPAQIRTRVEPDWPNYATAKSRTRRTRRVD
jgi:hypothetical protein